MKTDKLLKLFQQKKVMRSGGALPLPKHQLVGPVSAQLINQALGQTNPANVRSTVIVAPKNVAAQSVAKDIATYGSIEKAERAKAIKKSQVAQKESTISTPKIGQGNYEYYNPEQGEFRDDTKIAPEGSTRATFQNALNTANEFFEYGAKGTPMGGFGKLGYDMFVGAPAQSAINLSNTAMGDRPIRGDKDFANLGLDALNVFPYFKGAMSGGKKFITAFDDAGRMAFGTTPQTGIFSKSFGNLFGETTVPQSGPLRNLQDLQAAQKFAKKYGYELPKDINRIAKSDVLTDRTVRGLMNRHNTMVRGVSTNWEVLGRKNPQIIKDLENLGFNLSTEEGSRAAAEYMSTHIPGSTGYGRFGLRPGEDALYLSNSIPAADGYTYGDGFIVKVRRPVDFSSSNRLDWINKNDFDASLGFKNSPYGTGIVKNDYVKRFPTNFRELLATTGDPKTFDDVQKVIKEAEEKYRDIAHASWKKHNNQIAKYRYENSAAARRNVYKYDGKIKKDELNDFDRYYLSFLEKKKDFMNNYYGNAPAIPIIKHVISDADIWKSLGKNIFGKLDPFSHYAVKGTPGQKVFDAVESIRVTPETWKNTSRMHVNKYSNKLTRREEGGSLPKAQNGYEQAKARYITARSKGVMGQHEMEQLVNQFPQLINDPSVAGIVSQFNRTKNQEPITLEEKIDKKLNYPQKRAVKATDNFEIDRQIKRLEGMPTDNLRHALASRYTAENIQQQFPSFLKPTGIPQFTGFLGANALGLGHEIMTYYNNPNRSDRPLWETIRESGEDMYNNAFGSAVGVMPFLSDDQKTNIIQNAVINKKIPDGQHYGEFDINNYKNTNNTQKQKKGGLTKAQGGKEKLPEGFMSYESNPDYFDNHAVYHDNARYNDQIRSMVYSGKAAFNPTTGELRFIKGKPADASTQQMATEDYTRGVRRDPTDTQYAGADKRTKQIIQNTTKSAFENPLMYAPGMIGMSMLPMGWNVGYGLGQSGILGAQGDYKNAALTAGLSALPFVGQSVVPRVLQSNITPRLLGQNLTNRLFESHISPTNWTNYQIADDLGRGGFGSAYTFKNFPKHVWKMSDAKRVDDIIGVDFNKYRFEDIPRPVGNEYPIYHKSFINAENPKSTAAFLEWQDKFKSGSDIPKFNFELMSKVEGTPFFNLSSKQITGIPQSSWQGLKNTLEKLRVNDVGFDIQGHGNLIYNPQTKSFGVIDLTPGASTSKSGWQSHVLSDVNKNMSYDDATNAFKEIFKNKGNYRLKQIQTDIGRRINNNLIKNSGLDAWNQANLQLKLSKTPPTGNADYMNYHNLIKNRWQSTANTINSVQRKGGTLRRAELGNQGEDPLEQIKKWYAAHPDQKPKADQTPKSNNILGNKRQSDKQIMQGINDQAMLEYQQKESERIKGVASQYNMNPLDVKIQEDRFTALRDKRAKELEDGKSFREVGQYVNGQYIPSDVELGFKIPDAATTGIADPLNWPAMALSGAATVEGLGALGMRALPYTTPIMDALSAPAVVGGTEIPWLTGHNIMGAGFVGHVPGDIERGDYLSAALNSMPVWLNPSTIRFGANAINEGRSLFNQSKNAATQFGNRVILSKPVQSTMDVLNPGRILKQMREPENLSSKIDIELWKSKNRLIDIERNVFDNQYQKIKNYFNKKYSNDPNFIFLQNQLGKYKGILKNEKIFSQNVSNLGENGLLITEGSPFSRAVTTGETEIFDFATGKKIKVKVQLPGTSGAIMTKDGNNVIQSTFGNNQITPVISENLVPTLKSNNAWLESNTGGKVFGSSRGVSDADLVHLPDDAEVLISQANYEKNVANKYPLTFEGENVVTHELANGQGMIGTKNKGEVGFVIVQQNQAGKATGRRAEELFRQAFPEEYFKLNRESIKTGKPIEIPYTPDELINGIKPEVKTVMDSMEINTALPGKGKHTLRPDVYINYGDVDVVAEAQQKFIKSIVGEKGTVGPQFTTEQLSNVGQNKVVLKTIKFRGNIDLVAADPKRMQLALNDYYINRTTLSRGVSRINNSGKILTPEEIEAAFKDWDPHAQGGMAMGAGQNHVLLGNSGAYAYDFYGHRQVGLNNLKTDNVLDFVNSIENQTSGLKTFSQEEREIVKSILDKYSFNGSFRGYIPNSGAEFISAVATDVPLDKMRAVLKEYSDLTGKRIISTTDYGDSIYTSPLTDFDETLDAVEHFIAKDNQTGKVIAPVPTGARTRNDYYKQTTQLDLNKVFPNTNLENKTEKEIFYMIKNKLKDINLKLDHTMGKTNNKIAQLDDQIRQIMGRLDRKIENVKQSAINKNKGIDRSEEVNELQKKIANLEIERAAYQQQIDDLSKKYSRYVKINQKLGYMIGAPAILGASAGIAYGGLELIKKVDQNIKEDEKEKMKKQYDQSLKLSDKEFKEKFGFSKKEASTFEQFYKSIYEPGEDRRVFLRKRAASIRQQREQKKRDEDAKQQKLDSAIRSQFNFNNLFK